MSFSAEVSAYGPVPEPPGVEDYKVVYPKKLHALHKRDVKGIQNPQEKVRRTAPASRASPVLDNKSHSSQGVPVCSSVSLQDHCYYGGHIQGDTSSGASISTCRGLRGYFKSRGKRYLIEPLKLLDSEAHAVFKYESLEKEDEAPKVCGVTNTTWQMEEPIQKIARSSTSAEVSLSPAQLILGRGEAG
uniref:ADAM metallopeptidase domain 28 n=1 Tax=Varanus komodoensis TaxID=61221 RepID=A0A8D2LCF4_VARKO